MRDFRHFGLISDKMCMNFRHSLEYFWAPWGGGCIPHITLSALLCGGVSGNFEEGWRGAGNPIM